MSVLSKNLPKPQLLPQTTEKKEFIGHAVDPITKAIRFLSVSAIQKYDRKEEAGCPRAWWFRYIAGIKEPETEAMRRGTALAKEIEDYLKTGVDALSPVLRPGKPFLPFPGSDLHVEEEFGNLLAAVKFREKIIAGGRAPSGEEVAEIARLAGLTAAGIPLTGKPDFYHLRQEWIDAGCVVRREDPGMFVAEIVDNKTHSRLEDHETTSGNVERGYMKSVDEILSATQMVGYGVSIAFRNPRMTHGRLGHIAYQTKHAPKALKRCGLVEVDELFKRWDKVEGVVREMIDVAKEKEVVNVEANFNACHAYYKGCFYQEKGPCPQGANQMLKSFFLGLKNETPAKSPRREELVEMAHLFSTIKKSTAPVTPAVTPPVTTPTPVATPSPTPTPVVDPAALAMAEAQRQAEIAAAKAKFIAEEQAKMQQVVKNNLSMNDLEMDVEYLIGGKRAIFKGASKGSFYFEIEGQRVRYDQPVEVQEAPVHSGITVECAVCKTQVPLNLKESHAAMHNVPVAAVSVPAPAPVVTVTTSLPVVSTPIPLMNIAQVNPPIKVQYDLTDTADPLPADVIAQIPDPELRAKAQAHADLCAARKAAQHGGQMIVKEGGRCTAGDTKIPAKPNEVAEKRFNCPTCGKEFKGSKCGLVIDGDKFFFVVPRHNRLKDDQPVVMQPQPVVMQPQPVVMQPQPVVNAEVIMDAAIKAQTEHENAKQVVIEKIVNKMGEVVTQPQSDITIFIDALVTGNPQPRRLSDYYDEIVALALKEVGGTDLRFGPKDSPLGYGAWKGALALLVRSRPIPPGEWSVSSTDEIGMVVVDSLRNVRLVRGVR